MAQKIQIRRGTTSQWSTTNPILASGELGLDTDLKGTKIGDGTTAWNSLAFQPSAIVGFTGTIPTTGWSGGGANPFTIAVTINGITSNDVPTIDLNTSGITYSNLSIHNADFSRLYRVTTSTNTLTFFATGVPSLAIPISIRVVR
jgi:hypothetical protein